jgi:hypothetical protein
MSAYNNNKQEYPNQNKHWSEGVVRTVPTIKNSKCSTNSCLVDCIVIMVIFETPVTFTIATKR